MWRYVVKITQSKGQTRITIPRVVAVSTGLDKAKVIELLIHPDKSIKIKAYHGEEEKDGSI